jgi:hypothetical protein
LCLVGELGELEILLAVAGNEVAGNENFALLREMKISPPVLSKGLHPVGIRIRWPAPY